MLIKTNFNFEKNFGNPCSNKYFFNAQQYSTSSYENKIQKKCHGVLLNI